MAFIIVNDAEKYDFSLLVKWAGGDYTDRNSFVFNTRNNMLTVNSVDQQSLVLAYDQYDDNYNKEFLASAKTSAKLHVDKLVGNFRKTFITVCFGQEMVYYDKVDQAADYIAMGFPDDLSNYPFIKIEAEVTKLSPKEVVERILIKKREWTIINSKLEKIRLMAKYDISKSLTISDTQCIVDRVCDDLDKVEY